MKVTIEQIKLDRLINKFLSNLVSCGAGGYDYIFRGNNLFFCNNYQNKMVIRTYVFDKFSGTKYNRYIHNKMIGFIGLERDYALYYDLTDSIHLVNIDEYERIIGKD